MTTGGALKMMVNMSLNEDKGSFKKMKIRELYSKIYQRII